MGDMRVIGCPRAVAVVRRALDTVGFTEALSRRMQVDRQLIDNIFVERERTFEFGDFDRLERVMNLVDFEGKDRELLMYLAGQARGIGLVRNEIAHASRN